MTKVFHRRALGVGLLSLATLSPLPSIADASDRFGLIRYDSLSGFSLGDGVSFDDTTSPQGNCIDLATSTLKQDTPGVAAITAEIRVVSNVEDLEENLKTSLLLEANAEVGFKKIASAKLETSTTRKYESLLKEEISTLVVRIVLASDKGRDWLDYRMRQQYKDLLEGTAEDQDRFVEICGTHFVRAVQKEAALSIDLIVTNLSKSSKEVLATTADRTLSGKGTYKGITFGGKKANKETLDQFERLARELGTVSISMEGRGAPGLQALAPVLFMADGKAASLSKYLEKVSSVLATFDVDDAAPAFYITQAYPGLPDRHLDLGRALYLDKLLKQMIYADGALASYAQLQQDDPDFWSAHVVGTEAVMRRVRQRLQTILRRCVEDDVCNLRPVTLPNLVSKGDLLMAGRLGAVCGTDLLVVEGDQSFNVMSDIAIVWRGEIRFPNFVGLDSIKAFTIDAEGRRTALARFESSQDFSVDPVALKSTKNPDNKGPGRAISQIVNVKLPAEMIVQSGRMNRAELDKIRDEYGNMMYGLSFAYMKNNKVYDILLGRPDMSQCVLKIRSES